MRRRVVLVDVGRWLTGEPECMYSFVPMPNERMGRVVKIFIDYGASASFSAEFIRQRGIVCVHWLMHYRRCVLLVRFGVRLRLPSVTRFTLRL
jgi:hypothetical protein